MEPRNRQGSQGDFATPILGGFGSPVQGQLCGRPRLVRRMDLWLPPPGFGPIPKAEGLPRTARLRAPRPIILPNAPAYVRPPLPDRRRMAELAERWDRDTREPGASCGPLGGPRGVAVFRAIALAATDEPSIEEIRREAGCSRDTVAAALAALREVGAIEVDARYRLVPAPNGRGQQARRMSSRYRLPALAEFAARYESALRTALHPEEESLYRRRQAPPRRRRGDNSWEAPDAPPPEEEIEILTVEASPAAPEIAREEATDGESAAPPPPPCGSYAQAWPESLAEIAARRSAELWRDKPQRWATAPPGRILGAPLGDTGGASSASRPKTGLGRRYAAGSDPRPDG